MRWINGLSKSQRVVVVIAFGLALGMLGSYLVSLGAPVSGWYGFSPLTDSFYVPGLRPWLRLIIWLLVIVVWAAGSIWVLRPSLDQAASPEPERHAGD
jgi:hypothetical protein